MEMSKLWIYLLLSFVLFTFSCEEPYPYKIDDTTKYVIVEGLLTNEYGYQRVKLSYSFADPGDTIEYINNATVIVRTKGRQYAFHHPDSLPGIYISNVKFAATIDRVYTLFAMVDNKIYKAATEVYPVDLPDTLRYEYVPQEGLYRISYVGPVFDPFEASMYIIDLDWSNLPDYDTMPYDSTHARMYFFTLRTMDVNELFQPYQQQVFFPKGTRIVEKKYSLTPFFESYIRAMLIETQWSGSLFDTQHWNLPTNIEGGALGFFTASSVVKREYVVE